MIDERLRPLACPECRAPLKPASGDPDGSLYCRACGIPYAAKDGIVLLLPTRQHSADPWQETASGLAMHLARHPDLAKCLLGDPPDHLAPMDRYFRGLLVEESGRIAEGRDIQDQALCECYTEDWREAARRARARTAAAVAGQSGAVVDLVCGMGTLLDDLLALSHACLVATDVSPRVLRRVHRRLDAGQAARVAFLAMDAHQLAFRDESFDTLTTLEGLLNIPLPPAVLAEVRRVLRGDFWAIMSFYPIEDHGNREQLRSLGLEVIGLRSNALEAFRAAELQAQAEFEAHARACPAPPGRLLKGARIHALPAVETELSLCVVHARPIPVRHAPRPGRIAPPEEEFR
jgi:SAM-dependent methyltransferase/uncharacterized protein YbaR (Trm112 family)